MAQCVDVEKIAGLHSDSSTDRSAIILTENNASVSDRPRSSGDGSNPRSFEFFCNAFSGLGAGLVHQIKRIRGTSDSENFPILFRSVQDSPNGYPRFAAFLESDEKFMIYRQFGYMQARLLLEKQAILSRLETKLQNSDWDLNDENPIKLRTSKGHSTERKRLLDDIETTWLAYTNLLLTAQRMAEFNKPSKSEWCSVRNWLESVNPIRQEEARLIQCKEDLITVRPGREYAWLDAAVESFLRTFGGRLMRWAFQSNETKQKTAGSGRAIYYTRNRIDRFVLLIITCMILVLLIGPIFVLYHLTDRRRGDDDGSDISRHDFECIGVLCVFTLAFAAATSLFTKARRHEILASSAAYCAVLVVFIGNLQNGNNEAR